MMFKRIIGFLNTDDLLALTLAVYLGTIFERFLTSIVDGALTPLLFYMFRVDESSVKDINIAIGDKNTLEIGEIVSNLIHLCIGIFASYKVFIYLKNKSS